MISRYRPNNIDSTCGFTRVTTRGGMFRSNLDRFRYWKFVRYEKRFVYRKQRWVARDLMNIPIFRDVWYTVSVSGSMYRLSICFTYDEHEWRRKEWKRERLKVVNEDFVRGVWMMSATIQPFQHSACDYWVERPLVAFPRRYPLSTVPLADPCISPGYEGSSVDGENVENYPDTRRQDRCGNSLYRWAPAHLLRIGLPRRLF